jgi:hypothetical protein
MGMIVAVVGILARIFVGSCDEPGCGRGKSHAEAVAIWLGESWFCSGPLYGLAGG